MRRCLVGRVVGLWRYPVKSMAAEPVRAVDVSWHGLAGDRRWAFLRADRPLSGFPWLTIRQRNDLASYRPSLVDPAKPDASAIMVRTPAGECYPVTAPKLAEELGSGLRAIKQDRGVFDSMPLSMITTQSIDSLGELVGERLDAQRFRPNLLIHAVRGGRLPEHDWVGRELCVGGLRMRVDRPDKRCGVVNVDPVSGRREPSVLRAVVREHAGALGVYGQVVNPGRIVVGDWVTALTSLT